VVYDAWMKLLEAGIPSVRASSWFRRPEGLDGRRPHAGFAPRSAHRRHAPSPSGRRRCDRLGALPRRRILSYPSRYEGYGLPLVEAFRHGKAVLASTGAAVPESGRRLLAMSRSDRWRSLATHVGDLGSRTRCPARSTRRASRFVRHPDWDESARTFFALVRGQGASIGNAVHKLVMSDQ